MGVAPGEPSGSSEIPTRHDSNTKSGGWRRRVVKNDLTLKEAMDKLLKKPVKRSTWIYVSVGGGDSLVRSLTMTFLTFKGQKL